jgi:hypothetical protein
VTCLEHTLANILDSIERARAARDALALAALLQRKDAICAALAAPEQSWCAPMQRAAVSVAEAKITLVA